uniref:Uncharacterized protein LOC100374483 n=1 Tax=Saccoglossus kowalevskii TaxID=10224 RepID=A0ABM0GUZ5_SACKO|nr:PREDICTED: uncharacterized protein LOC100374483 [Saccoglossus kowalevskii]
MDFSRDQHMLLQAAITLLLVTSHITAAPTETVFTTTEPEALTLDDGDNNVFAEVRQASIGSVFEEYQRLTRLTSEFRNANKDVFGNFKQLRLNGDDIDSDLHAFTFEGLPNPVSRFQSRFLQERDLIVLHRDNLLQFQSFIDAMYMDELDVFYDEEGETPFHEEFQSLALQIRKIVTKCNSSVTSDELCRCHRHHADCK